MHVYILLMTMTLPFKPFLTENAAEVNSAMQFHKTNKQADIQKETF